MFNKVWYDRTKFFAQIVLPGLGSLYFGLAEIWGLPYGAKIVGSIMVVDTFLGVLLGISTSNYYKGDARYSGVIEVKETDNKITYGLGLNDEPEELKNKSEVLFKVEQVPDTPGRHERR